MGEGRPVCGGGRPAGYRTSCIDIGGPAGELDILQDCRTSYRVVGRPVWVEDVLQGWRTSYQSRQHNYAVKQ